MSKRTSLATGATVASLATVLGLHTYSSASAVAGALRSANRAAPASTGAASAGGSSAGASSAGASSAGGSGGGASPSAAPVPAPPGVHTATGPNEQFGYGALSVTVAVDGSKITNVTVGNLQTAESYSQQLCQQVIPMLLQQVLSVQSAQIQGISGATYLSEAYALSVQGALKTLNVA
ncbi:MAG: FMN-binding protein [Mycobacteriales bacterium]